MPGIGPAEIAKRLTEAGTRISRQRAFQIGEELGLDFATRRGRASEMPPLPAVVQADTIRDWRRAHGDITQPVLAAMLGISRDTLARWERGDMPPPRILGPALKGLECGVPQQHQRGLALGAGKIAPHREGQE